MGIMRKIQRAFRRDGLWNTLILCTKNIHPPKLDEDAVFFDFPPGPLVVWFYHAFTKEVLVHVNERLLLRQDATIFVYYSVHYQSCSRGVKFCMRNKVVAYGEYPNPGWTRGGKKLSAETRLASSGCRKVRERRLLWAA